MPYTTRALTAHFAGFSKLVVSVPLGRTPGVDGTAQATLLILLTRNTRGSRTDISGTVYVWAFTGGAYASRGRCGARSGRRRRWGHNSLLGVLGPQVEEHARSSRCCNDPARNQPLFNTCRHCA